MGFTLSAEAQEKTKDLLQRNLRQKRKKVLLKKVMMEICGWLFQQQEIVQDDGFRRIRHSLVNNAQICLENRQEMLMEQVVH